MTEKQKTASGREVKRTGMNDAKMTALQKLKAAREGNIKRTDQYEVQEEEQVFEEIDGDEYQRRQDARRDDDFIVDDEGFGYKDNGGEIWEDQDDEPEGTKKKKKIQKDDQTINQFMFNSSLKPKKLVQPRKAVPKVDEQQSKDIMNQLFEDLDGNEELVEHVAKQPVPVVFNKQDELTTKYAVQAPIMQQPAQNMFSKKRLAEEITKPQVQVQEDVQMTEEPVQTNQLIEKMASAQVSIQKSVEDDWQKLKTQNQLMNTDKQFVDSSQDLPLPLNPDGSLNFFWIDAFEETFGSEIYIFGKVWQPQINQYVSCTLQVQGMERTLYALPKLQGKSRAVLTKEDEDQLCMNVFAELEEIRKKRFSNITRWKCKGVTRKYCFEMPLPHGEHRFLKIKYPSTMPPLPLGLTGNTFDAIFGCQQSMLELFILKRKIKGPCWLTLTNVQRVTQLDQRRSWTKHEIKIESPKDATCTLDDLNKAAPPLVSLTFSCKMTRSQHNTTEIAMISCLVQQKVNQDGPTMEEKFSNFTLVRKLDSLPLPFDAQQKVKNNKTLTIYQNEKTMIETFIHRLHQIDPDLLVAHNLCGSVIEVLLARIGLLRISHWSRIGRLKRAQLPNRKSDGFGASWVPRTVSCGRLLVDTFLNAKELVRETNYDLGHLAKVQLKQDRKEFDEDMLPRFYQTFQYLEQLAHHTESDAYITYQLMMHLQIVPLTKQLTTIAGNLWFRSLQNARAERNEWLLMHEFYSRKFLCPDKKNMTAREAKKAMFGGDEEADAKPKGKKRGKAKYGGGLVLEPKAGFYDSIILLLDFNSLYPSIIQEYNLCFTTVERKTTKNFDGSEAVAIIKDRVEGDSDAEELDGAEEVQLPEKTGTANKDAILPNVLRNLVQKRKLVKDQIKRERDQVKLGQLDIRQKALKLTANSMYGCLGFSSSRFYAQAIAALITRTGRETLLKTKELAEEKLGFNVVYGDTDSIMINTGTQNLKDSLEMGKRLKQEVNVLYKCLEIEIDGVFKSLLLLKKKKYAALKVEDFNGEGKVIVKEIKGLDMVRRDWCNLSKEVGNKVLDEILSGKDRERIIVELNDYFSDISKSMKNGLLEINQYIITKQLTKGPSEYSDFKALPHVAIANKLKMQGKSEADLVGNFIPYLICVVDEKDAKAGLAAKARHPDELLASRGSIMIDVEWYIMQQVLPPITRLIEHIDGINIDFISSCFGIDAKKHRITDHGDNAQEESIPQAILKTETHKSLKERAIAKLVLQCPSCGQKEEFNGVFQKDSQSLSGMLCPAKIGDLKAPCNRPYPVQYVKNRVSMFLRQLLERYYEGSYVCSEPSCQTRTRQLLYEGRCVVPNCKGRVQSQLFSERVTNDTLRYLQGLFDVKRYRVESTMKGITEIPYEESFNSIKMVVDEVMNQSKYNKVDLGALFAFMNK